ncbi:hypothetical protein IG631_16406 [Alternaria alternata]|nr:hypothetical protein IG631_16406 [Alternaria alternata]
MTGDTAAYHMHLQQFITERYKRVACCSPWTSCRRIIGLSSFQRWLPAWSPKDAIWSPPTRNQCADPPELHSWLSSDAL